MLGGRRKRPGEMAYAGTNLIRNRGLRMAKVTRVPVAGDDLSGTIDVKYLDGPGGRERVIAVQNFSEAYVMPMINDYVVVGFSADESQCFVVGYIPNQIRAKLDRSTPNVPPMMAIKPGDTSQQGKMGQGLYMTMDGNITMGHVAGGYVQCNLANNMVEIKDINTSIVTEGGSLFFGVVKRFAMGTFSRIISKFGGLLRDTTTAALTEFVLKINGASNLDINSTSDAEVPVVIVRGGNVVDDNGLVTANVRAQINVYSPDPNNDATQCSIKLRDDGTILIQGKNIVFSPSPDNNIIPEKANTLVKFDEFAKVITDLKDAINMHSHPNNGAAPFPSLLTKLSTDSCKTSYIKVG